MDYCIGDRVRATDDCIECNNNIKAGMTGTIVDIVDNMGAVGVAFDENINGHCCSDEALCPYGNGWYIYNPERDLEVIEIEIVPSVPEDALLGFLS